MADYAPTVFVDSSGPAATAGELNKIESGVQDAAQHHQTGTLAARPTASAANKNWTYYAADMGTLYCNFDGATWTLVAEGWIEVDLTAASSYTITMPPSAREIEVQIDGRMSGAVTASIMVQPQGPGTALNGRSARKYTAIDTADATLEGMSNDTEGRDQGMALARYEVNPQDILATGTYDFARTGVGQSRAVSKRRDASNTAIVGHDYKSFLYTIAQPTSVKVNFAVGSAATFTGKLRYRFRT